MPRSRTTEPGDARPPDALLFCPRGCPRGRKVRRNAKAHSSSEGLFASRSLLREEIARRHFQPRSVTRLFRVTRASSVRGSFRSGESDWRKKRCQSTAVDRSEKRPVKNSEFPSGCPRQENVSRSICSVRKSYPRGYFFRARPKRERIGRRPAGVQNTRALTDARLRRRTSRARTCPARLRPRSDPSARRRNQTPADRRPSQRPRRRSFFTGTHS